MSYKVIQGYIRLYKVIQGHTRLYRVTGMSYKVIQGYTRSQVWHTRSYNVI